MFNIDLTENEFKVLASALAVVSPGQIDKIIKIYPEFKYEGIVIDILYPMYKKCKKILVGEKND